MPRNKLSSAPSAGSTPHAIAATVLAGALSALAAASPASSTGGPGNPHVTVTPDCPTTGFLPGGQPCVSPAGGGGEPSQPAPPETPDPPAPAQPDPAPAADQPDPGQPAAAPAPAADATGAPAQAPAAPTAAAPAPSAKSKRKSATKLGRPRVESRTQGAEPRRDRAGARKPRPPAPAPNPIVGAPGGAGSALPSLSFSAPSPAAAVPDVLIDRFPIPPFLLPIYQAAGIEYGIPWQILAAINEIETDYGRNLNVSSAGAMGWMQFIPSSWKAYGVDANDDGKADPYNPVDAIFAAARYLKAAGAENDMRRAIYAYNHAWWYVDSVMLRAKLVRALPDDLVGALTGLTQGHFPVGGPARYPREQERRRNIVIDARAGAPVVAVNDGIVRRIATSRSLGRHVVLQDVFGNTYTYAHMGSVAAMHAAPRPGGSSESRAPKRHGADPRPRVPATAGLQPRSARPGGARRTTAGGGERVRVAKARLFANPSRPSAFKAGGDRQLAQQSTELPAGAKVSAFSTVPLPRGSVVLRPLRAGSQVIGGAILGRAERDGRLGFSIRPAGAGAPAVDPKPVLDGWKMLASTNAHRGLRGASVRNPTIGQLMLMTKEQLIRRVLADPRIEIYGCGRQDIAAGAIDRRVLATLMFMAASRLHPTVSALECGHSYYTAAGGVSAHSSGDAVDIAAVNGKPILGNQGKGSITDVTIRRLLTLQGAMRPNQIISLMTFAGHSNTLSLSDHHDHIHVGFEPHDDASSTTTKPAAVLKPGQWTRLIDRLGKIDNPRVPGADLPEPKPRPGKVRVRLRLPRHAPALSALPPRS